MNYETLDFKLEDGIATVKLNRPDSYNALNTKMSEEFADLFTKMTDMDEVRAVVLTGAGKAFCAGGDIKEMLETRDIIANDVLISKKNMEINSLMVCAMVNFPKPVISAVNGVATGAGVSIAIAADIIIASENAKFCEIFGQVGFVPDLGGTYLLPRLVGRAKAKELIFTQEMIGADEAYRIGLVNKLVPADKLLEETYKMAGKIAKGATTAYGLSKKLINQSFEVDLATALDNEMYCQIICSKTKDHKEGVDAFVEKRKPNFIGK